ncbi:NEL-type E3 ubiquitin ligase domain-containing protein [Pararobbsia silviterrae]|uniref:NEL-type E3 ubiquitin ligase domain-containing protein n=1 Tax=Pararobbsia silviterrae TaxID=1792498 RepID=UPI001314621D|nr:NEL-type E3 ubiquitin ligase domain-containing protein [Pararobbsia silviterrae]
MPDADHFRRLAERLATPGACRTIRPECIAEILTRLPAWPADVRLALISRNPDGGVARVIEVGREAARRYGATIPIDAIERYTRAAPGPRDDPRRDALDAFLSDVLDALDTLDARHRARWFEDAAVIADAPGFDPVTWVRDAVSEYLMTHAPALAQDRTMLARAGDLESAGVDYAAHRDAFDAQCAMLAVPTISKPAGVFALLMSWLTGVRGAPHARRLARGAEGASTVDVPSMHAAAAQPPQWVARGPSYEGGMHAGTGFHARATSNAISEPISKPISKPILKPAAKPLPKQNDVRIARAAARALARASKGGPAPSAANRATWLSALFADHARHAQQARRNATDMSDTWARALARHERSYGARRGETMASAYRQMLLSRMIEFLASGSAEAPPLTLGGLSLAEAARAKQTTREVKDACVSRISRELGVSESTADWAATCLFAAHLPVCVHPGVPGDLVLGSLEWVDVQNGMALAESLDADPFDLSYAALLSYAQTVEVAQRNGTLPAHLRMEGMLERTLFALHGGWRAPQEDTGPLHEVAYAHRTNDTVWHALAVARDLRYDKVGRLLARTEALAKFEAKPPMTRRTFTQRMLRKSLPYEPTDAMIEHLMSHDVIETRNGELSLDALYGSYLDTYRARIEPVFTHVARDALDAMGMPGSGDASSSASIRLLMPHVEITKHAQWAASPGDVGFEPARTLHHRGRDDVLIVAWRTGRDEALYSINLPDLLNGTTASEALLRPFVSDERLLAQKLGEARGQLFLDEANRDVRWGDEARWGVETWSAPRPQMSAAAQIGYYFADVYRAHAREAGYEATAIQKRNAALVDFLKSLVPFHDFIQHVRAGQSSEAVGALGRDVIALIPLARAIGKGVTGLTRLARIGGATARAGSANAAGAITRGTATSASAAALRLSALKIARGVAREAVLLFDPGFELALGAGRLAVSGARWASTRLGRFALALDATIGAAVHRLPMREPNTRTASIRGRVFPVIDLEGHAIPVKAIASRTDGGVIVHAVDPHSGLPYGPRLAIDAHGRVAEAAALRKAIPLRRIDMSHRFETALPAGTRVEVWPYLRAQAGDHAVLRIDDAFYTVHLRKRSPCLRRVDDGAVLSVGRAPDAVSATRGASVDIELDGSAEAPMLRVTRSRGDAVAGEPVSLDAQSAQALERYRASPRLPAHAQPNRVGMIAVDGRRYVRIGEHDYFVVFEEGTWRVCHERARWKPGLPIAFDAATNQWAVRSSPNLPGGVNPDAPRVESAAPVNSVRADQVHAQMVGQTGDPQTMFEQWVTHHGVPDDDAKRIRLAIETGAAELDLSAIPVTSVPNFLRTTPGVKALSLRIAAVETFTATPHAFGEIERLRLFAGDAASVVIMPRRADVMNNIEAAPLARLDLVGGDRLREISLHAWKIHTLDLRDVDHVRRLICEWGALETFDLPDMRHLEILDLKDNRLTALRVKDTHAFPALDTLDLSRNALTSLPRLNAPRLDAVLLSDNRLTDVESLEHLASISTLDLRRNALQHVPVYLASRDTLKTYLLAANDFDEVDADIGAFRHLQTLDLSSNRIGVLPDAIGSCRNLQSLDVSYNRLVTLPPSIGTLPHLQMLDLAVNDLFDVPSHLTTLRQLRDLDLAANHIRVLPDRIDDLPLERLCLDDNPLDGVPAPLLRAHTRSGQPSLPDLEYLAISRTGIASLPQGIGHHTRLDVIEIDGNPRLDALPDDLTRLVNLRELQIERCGLVELPPVLAGMRPNTIARLNGNPLSNNALATIEARNTGRSDWRPASGARLTNEPAFNDADLDLEVEAWRSRARLPVSSAARRFWRQDLASKGTMDFALLLRRLAHTAAYRSGGQVMRSAMIRRVNDMLDSLEDAPELRASVVALATDGVETCVDRVQLCFDSIRTTVALHRIESEGGLSAGTALLRMRDTFRREHIANAAQSDLQQRIEQIQSGAGPSSGRQPPSQDLVEIELAYLTGIGEYGIHLIDEAQRMMFVRYADVARASIARVAIDIRAAERLHLSAYMVERDAWRSYLERHFRAEYEAVCQTFDDRIPMPPDSSEPEIVSAFESEAAEWGEQRKHAIDRWRLDTTNRLIHEHALFERRD